jgi:hypothetical protein
VACSLGGANPAQTWGRALALSGRRTAICFGVVVFLVAAVVGPLTGRATADCSTEEQVYGGGNSGAYGTTNNIRLTDRDLNTACGTPQWEAFSEAHVELGGVWGNWVEMGWLEFIDGGTGAHVFEANTEWGLAGNIKGQQVVGVSCIKPSNVGSYYKWRVNNVSGSNDWTLLLNCGSGFAQVSKYSGTGYHTGTAAGETGRYGGTATGMSESQNTLKYKNGSGTWTSWTTNYCYKNTASNWQYSYGSATAYSVVKGSANC